jgi:GAF domain-containing protein
MAEDLKISNNLSKREKYRELLPQIKALVIGEENLIANLANVSAALKEAFNFLWVGFYLVEENELVLGPFQGPVACTRIQKGKGVCGKSWETKEVIIVKDVEKFETHIACSSFSKSEIVLPLKYKNQIIGVLDVDSEELNTFDEVDSEYLNKVLEYLK